MNIAFLFPYGLLIS